jgi:hypothetical protein
MSVSGVDELLSSSRRILLVDWPQRTIPERLVRAGLTVFVKGGPAEHDIVRWTLESGTIARHATGSLPTEIDIVYAHRPSNEFAYVFSLGQRLGAKLIWLQSGRTASGGTDPQAVWMSDGDLALVGELSRSHSLPAVTSEFICDRFERGSP